jgi:hypothetical protein
MPKCPRCHLAWGRSPEEHNTLFGVIGMAFDNWPEMYDYQPPNADHLRGWLAIRVGHVRIVSMPDVRGLTPEIARDIAKMFTDGREHYEVVTTGKKIDVVVAASMQKTAMHIRDFRVMANCIYEILTEVCGINPEVYKHEKDKAA